MIPIPKSFELVGRTWKVKFLTPKQAKKDLGLDRFNDTSGYCSTLNATIYILYDETESAEYRRITFWHEFVHAVMLSMGLHDAEHDETAVEAMALLLDQFDKTRKGEVDLG